MTDSWLRIPSDSDFSLDNLPFGVFTPPSAPSNSHHIGVAIGDHVLDLYSLSASSDYLQNFQTPPGHCVFQSDTLNDFASLGRAVHREVRSYIRDLFVLNPREPALRNEESLRKQILFLRSEVTMHLPMEIGDYTDFYAGMHHAYNVGVLFRGPENALQPNYKHLPVGYHGRASSVVVSGTDIARPWGQVLDPETKQPVFKPCEGLDLELEVGAFVCKENGMGRPIPIDEAEEYVFGYVLMNDWSARDVQRWEYVPLGPFNSKNFGTSISSWVVLADALEPFHCNGIENDVELQPYLREKRQDRAIDINLGVDLITSKSLRHRLTSTTSANLLFSFPQMLAHHSITGCPMRTGDLLGSGTISGAEPGTEGSLLEQSKGGKTPLKLADTEETKVFLQDGDTIVIRGCCQKDGVGRVGFGECSGTIKPAIDVFPK